MGELIAPAQIIPHIQARQFDLFALYDLEVALYLPCSSARRFLDYLASPGAKRLRCMFSVPSGTADMTLDGPLTDDSIWDKQGEGARHQVRYKLTKAEVWENLTHDERLQLEDLACEKGQGFDFKLFCKALRIAPL